MFDFSSFRLQRKCHRGCALSKESSSTVIHHLYSIHPNLCLLSYLLNVLLQNVCSMRVKSAWIPAGAPMPSSRCTPHIIGTRDMSTRVLSVFLFPPSRRVGTTQPSWPACSVQEQTPQPKISSCFHSPLPRLHLTHFPGGFIWLDSWLMINVNSVIGQQFGGRCFLGSTSHWS